MNKTSKLLLATLPLIGLAACNSSDGIGLNVFEPQVRLAHVAPGAPNVTLQRNGSARAEATDRAYGFTSNYFNVDTGGADWSVKVASSGANVGTVNFDSQRSHKYTVLAVSESATSYGVALINDPTNPSIVNDNARVRTFNGSYNAQNIDVYLGGLDQNIGSLTPDSAGVAFKSSGPGTGVDSLRRRGGTYKVTITPAGSKTILFQGRFAILDNKDVLFITVPNAAANPTGINLLVKVDGDAGAIQVPAI